MLFNGLGRFQNALGTFQEAPERESLIFYWFWKVFWGARQGRADAGGGLSDPLNLKDKPNTTGTGQVLGLGQGQGPGQGQAQAQGQGQGHRASGQEHPLTRSRKARWRI